MNSSSIKIQTPEFWSSRLVWFVVLPLLGVLGSVLVARYGIKFVVLPAAACAAFAILKRPNVATLFVVFAIYSNVAVLASKFHGVPFVVAAAVPMLLVWPIWHYVVVQRRPLVITPVLWLVFGFTLIQLAGSLFSIHPDVSLPKAWISLLEGFVLYFLVTNAVRSSRLLHQIVWVLICVGAILGSVGLVQRVTESYANHYGGLARIDKQAQEQLLNDPSFQPRQAGPIGVENRYAHMMLMLLPLGLMRFWNEKRWDLRLAALGGTGLIAIGIALTYSRGAVIAFAVVVLAMLAMRLVRWKQVAALGLVAVLVVAIFPAYRDRFLRVVDVAGLLADDVRTTSIATDSAIMGRANEAVTAALVFGDHPILGVGSSMFPFHYEQYSSMAGFRQHAGQRMAHNLYLGLAAEHGILGLACMLTILFLTLLHLHRARKRWRVSDPLRSNLAATFFLVVIAYMAAGLFADFSYIRFFWLMMALAAVAGRTETWDNAQSDNLAGT